MQHKHITGTTHLLADKKSKVIVEKWRISRSWIEKGCGVLA